ncbi:hypothetical protein FHL15_001570 [Xylaria flabelliformis]|uniref:Uncharacterized protein n=1 Tax=Xylaria flabelliformis TaxID=2512241 RepID=A0A553IAS0_9PEZI|nr:hypothetical protein FHL15_001570 [Xylaria flabelliformis]
MMAFPQVPTYWDSEGAISTLPTTRGQDYHYQASDDAAIKSEPQDTVTDYTSYSAKGPYGIFEASVREHPDRGTEAKIRLNLSAIELIMDVAIAIALIIFMYYAYALVAEEYASNSHRLAPGSHGVIHAHCTCSSGRFPIMDIRSSMI